MISPKLKYLIYTRWIVIFHERAGVISPDPCWVCLRGPYMYTGDTLLGLLRNMRRQWNNERNIVGYG